MSKHEDTPLVSTMASNNRIQVMVKTKPLHFFSFFTSPMEPLSRWVPIEIFVKSQCSDQWSKKKSGDHENPLEPTVAKEILE